MGRVHLCFTTSKRWRRSRCGCRHGRRTRAPQGAISLDNLQRSVFSKGEKERHQRVVWDVPFVLGNVVVVAFIVPQKWRCLSVMDTALDLSSTPKSINRHQSRLLSLWWFFLTPRTVHSAGWKDPQAVLSQFVFREKVSIKSILSPVGLYEISVLVQLTL